MKKPLLSAVLLALAVPALAAEPKPTECSSVSKAQLRALYETSELSQIVPGTGTFKIPPSYWSSMPDETLTTWQAEIDGCEREIFNRTNLGIYVADLDRLGHRDIVDLYIFDQLYHELDFELDARHWRRVPKDDR